MEKNITHDDIHEQRAHNQQKLVDPPFHIRPEFIATETSTEQYADEYTGTDNDSGVEYCRNQASLTQPANTNTKAIIASSPLSSESYPAAQNISQQSYRWGTSPTSYTSATQMYDTILMGFPVPNYLDDGYLTRQAIQSLSENYAKSQLALWYQQEKNREELSFIDRKMSLQRAFKECDKGFSETEDNYNNNTIPLHKPKAKLREYELAFIDEYAITKIKCKYGGWQPLIRYTDSNRHVPISNQELEQTYYSYLYDTISTNEEVTDSSMKNSFKHLINTIRPLDKSGLRILNGTEIMWENGIYDVLTSSFTPMNPSEQQKCFNLFSIDCNFPNEFKNPDGFDAVLLDMFEKDDTKSYLTYQIVGAIVTPIPMRKKIFLFQGKSDGGKTRLASLISGLMTYEDAVQLNTLSEVTDANLLKTQHPIRMVNVAEVGRNKLPAKQIVSLKSFADGLQAPGMAAFKIVMSTNYPIVTGENGFLEPALKVRLLTLPFPKAMSNSDPVVASYEDCAFEEEKPYIIIKALLAFREVLENNWTFCHEYPVNGVIEDNGDTTQENTTDGLTDEELVEIQRRNNNPTVLPLSLEQLFNMRLVLTDAIDAKTSLSAQQIMDDLNSIHPKSLNSREWTGLFLKRHYGERLKSKRFEDRGTCYNLAFATETKKDTYNEQ